MNTFFAILFVLGIISTLILLITSFVFRFKKKHNTKKFFKFTGIAFIVSIISFAGFGMSMTPEDKQKDEEKKLEEQKNQDEKQKQEEDKKLAEQKKQEEFSNYAQNIKGGAFIKDIKLTNNEAEITYYDSYSSFKSQKPDSNVNEGTYKQYFATGDAIEKMFVSEPARLLRQFPDVNGVKMTLPFDGKTYSINLDRKSLNKYIGLKIESLKSEDQSWQKKFLNPYVYDKAKRAEYFKKFVTVQ
ncbi:hypothetical protein ACEOWJ_002588 [Bacillus cereus]|uniref:hypothetical protein n=1 Tax=Bacillus TaxID=1386 RepID=UPI00054EC8DE|nr:hypothetical protein [Bacillus sp. UNC322MFChir4.1]